MVENIEGCCEESQPTNPKTDLWKGRKRATSLPMFDTANPIPAEISDSDELAKTFSDYNLVPYAGSFASSGDSLLAWYTMLAKLSPTHAACIKKLVNYAVGGKVMVVRKEDSEWQTEAGDEVSTSEAQNFRDKVKEFIEFGSGGISNLHKISAIEFKRNGNAFIELTHSKVGNQDRFFVRFHKTSTVKFLNTKKGAFKAVAVSKLWSFQYIEKNPPRVIPCYPVFSENQDGTESTMFHLKNGENEWYGRPDSEASDLYKYREVQDAIYLVKQAAGNFTGQLIIEVEDDDPESNAAFDEETETPNGPGFIEKFEQNYTQKSDDPQSVLITARPYGAKPMFVFQVNPNTKEQWYLVTGGIAESKIMHSHEVTARFLGKEVAGGFSPDAFTSDYVVNMEPVINNLRNEITGLTNKILTCIWLDFLNMPEMNQYSIDFTDPIQGTIGEIKGNNNGNPDSTGSNQT